METYKLNEETQPQDKEDEVWPELRDKFYKECTDNFGNPVIILTPRDLFEWFKNNLQSVEPLYTNKNDKNL